MRMRQSAWLLVVVFSVAALVPPVSAQSSHAAPQSAIDAALQQKVAGADADRNVVLRLLDRAELQSVAGELGLDLRRAKDAVSTLEGQQLTDLAAQANKVEQALAGGQSVTISTTLIIIGLLVLILLILALN